MKKKTIVALVILLAVGFAAVSTTLFINGNILFNTFEDNFDVYFSGALIDGEDYSNKVISEDKKTITFDVDDLKYKDDSTTLEYEVTNASTNYDAEVEVECVGEAEEISIVHTPKTQVVLARQVETGTVTITLNKTVLEEVEITYTCTLNASAVERTSIDETELAIPDTFLIEGNYIDEEDTPIANVTLVIYTGEEAHYITTDEEGYLFYNGLERGVHEIYYVNDTLENIKLMSKEEILTKAIASAEFTTVVNGDITFTDKSKITNKVIKTTKEYCEPLIGTYEDFQYTGSEQEFISKCPGTYRIELWGASGGNPSNGLGNGAYTLGEIYLSNDKLYVYVGGVGNNIDTITTGGWNGGGGSTKTINGISSGSTGGGATDIRLKNGNWNNFESLKSRIMVAAGGAGSHGTATGYLAQAGGLIGYDGAITSVEQYPQSGKGATQISTGALPTLSYCGVTNGTAGGFGFGGNGGQSQDTANTGGGAGAGSGYYGGSGASGICNGTVAGGGGSSFISGHNGCDAITEVSTESNIVHTGQPNHYSGYVFTNTIMIDGAGYNWTTVVGTSVIGMPTYDGTSTMTGNSGNGYAKITYLSLS